MRNQEVGVGSLQSIGQDLSKAHKEGQTGLTRMAPVVCDVVDQWEQYEVEAKGATPNQWLSNCLGRRRNGTARDWVGQFRRLHTASSRLGRMWMARFSSSAIVYLNSLTDQQLDAVKLPLQREARASGGVLNERQVRDAVARELGIVPQSHACEGCVQLLARVRELEAELKRRQGDRKRDGVTERT